MSCRDRPLMDVCALYFELIAALRKYDFVIAIVPSFTISHHALIRFVKSRARFGACQPVGRLASTQPISLSLVEQCRAKRRRRTGPVKCAPQPPRKQSNNILLDRETRVAAPA
jgi:hypothetical protein